MKKALMLVALAAMLLPTPVPAQPPGNAEILTVAKAFDDAQQHGDRAALERLLAADFLFVPASGKIGDRRDFIEGFTAPGHSLEPFRIIDPLFIRAGADVAIVGGEAWVKGVDGGRPFTRHFRYSDTLARREGRWVVIYAQVSALPTE